MDEKKKKQYVSDNAHLMAEWDWDKNSVLGIDPTKLTIYSHVKAYWLCSNGHSFEAAISNRAKGSKCTVCLNRVIVPGINDLQTLNPDVAKEWNYAKNEDLLPTMVARSASKKVWWICPEGHEYQATVNQRASGNGCPVCAGKKVVIGYNDIASKFPDIVSEWDYEKNTVLPTELTQGSQLRIWWKCNNCGHSWKTSVSNRVRGTGCPECAKIESGNKHRATIVQQTGSLLKNAPTIAAEWHTTKNGSLSPDEFTLHSAVKVWWICSVCGYEWKTAISNRVNGNGCPICGKKKFANRYRENVIQRVGSLLEKEPEIASEWHPIKNGAEQPSDFSPGSGKNVWWRCKHGHEWKTTIAMRTKYRTGCPVCCGRIPIKGVDDLVTTHPLIASQWHPTKNGELKPSDFKIGSDKVVWWKCEKGHEWKTNIYHRKATGCPECIKEKFTSFPEQAIYFYLLKDFPSIKNRYMLDGTVEIDIYIAEHQIAIEYDGARFHNTTVGLKRDQQKYEYLRNKNIFLIRVKESKIDEYSKDVADVCLGYQDNKNNRNLVRILTDLQKVLSEKINMPFQWDIDLNRDRQKIYKQYLEIERQNSIAIQYPHLLNEWLYELNDPITPYMVTKGSEKVFWWRCSNGHEYQAKVKQRVRNGCPYCANIKVLAGYNDLATTHPQLAKEWFVEKNNYILPSQIIGGKQIVWWKCNLGHEWQASIDSRKQGRGCPICAGKQVLKGYNDLASTNPDLSKQWNFVKNTDLSPTEITSHSNKSVWWICECGHEWQAVISSRTRGNGCPYCSNQKVLAGYNDLVSKYPDIASEWNFDKNSPLLPTETMYRSGKKVWWKCHNGHEWQAKVSYRTTKQLVCPICTKVKKKSVNG